MIFSVVVVFFVLIYRFWVFSPGTLSSGDWPYLFLENIKEFRYLPEIRFLWLAPYYQIFTRLVSDIGLSWNIIERVFWFWLFIALAVYCSYRLTRSAIGVLTYVTNTYILMVVGGGQMGVAFSYALAPLVFLRCTELIRDTDKKHVKSYLSVGILLAVQMMFDPRIAAVTIFGSIFVGLFQYGGFQNPKRLVRASLTVVRALFFPAVIAVVMQGYWIIPLLITHTSISKQVSEATTGAVHYLSFAAFPQSLSLLQPNWPENIFGKISFMKPEFLIIPIVGFLFLIFSRIPIYYLSIGMLTLMGAFLGKGTNGPFGDIYVWLFQYMPGFSAFRDPTKFYLFVALGYSVLIPYSLERVASFLESCSIKIVRMRPTAKAWLTIVSLGFILYWGITIRSALLGQLNGTFQPSTVPLEYIQFKNFLYQQPEYFQTFWMPVRQRFGFASRVHPALEAAEVLHTSNVEDILRWIKSSDARIQLVNQSVRYVIVPLDLRKEIFLTDRQYDGTVRQKTLDTIAGIPWLRRLDGFGEIGVFEVR